MRLATMNIKNYRQFKNETIFYDEALTILAGANNSGKTSLVELFRNIFIKRDKGFSVDDLPVIETYNSANKLVESMIDIYSATPDKDMFLNSLSQIILKDSTDMTMESLQGIEIKIEVVYDEDEKITAFSDYLMELNSENRSFYFQYNLKLNAVSLNKEFQEKFAKLKNRIIDYNSTGENLKADKKLLLCEFILKQYDLCLEEKYYYCNNKFDIQLPMKSSDFKNLFYCNFIRATRDLNDQKDDKSYSISNEMLAILASDEKWETIIDGLPENILDSINKTTVRDDIKSGSIHGLQKTLEVISKTTDGNVGEMSLNVDVDDDDIMVFLKKSIEARFRHETIYLKDSSQGLGFSNWIYIYLKIKEFCTKMDADKVNFFVIEEPEAHMHPHMQRALIKHLNDSYCTNKIQGVLTTHSHELVRASSLDKIRVIRQVKPFVNKIYDMNVFNASLEKGEEQDFFNLMFSINYSDLIFSSKIIMYEGDTEKLFIETVLKNEKFLKLSDQYISYVQVGGAYAHNYKKLINFLNIKTLILTDIDYDKALVLKVDIIKSETTNASIKNFYKDKIYLDKFDELILKECVNCSHESEKCFKKMLSPERLENSSHEDVCKNDKSSLVRQLDEILKEEDKIVIKDIYDWVQSEDNNIFVKFQTSEDAFSRTLEEAMLCKYLNMSLNDEKNRAEWEKIRKVNKLKFSIPGMTKEEKKNYCDMTPEEKIDYDDNTKYNIRNIVQATGKSKTDFMYSVILNGKEMDMLPCYLEEGLKWLEK